MIDIIVFLIIVILFILILYYVFMCLYLYFGRRHFFKKYGVIFNSLGYKVAVANFFNPVPYFIRLEYMGRDILGLNLPMGYKYKGEFRIRLKGRSMFNFEIEHISLGIFSSGNYDLVGNYLTRKVEAENMPDSKEKARALLEDLYSKMQYIEKIGASGNYSR